MSKSEIPQPAGQRRLDLERRGDLLLERMRCAPLEVSADAAPETHIVLLVEGRGASIVRRADMLRVPSSRLLPGLPGILAEIATAPQDDGRRYPVLIVVDGWIQVAFEHFDPCDAAGVRKETVLQ